MVGLLFLSLRVLFENHGANKFYSAVRTVEGETYVEYNQTGEKEYYDLRTDPWQENSEHDVSTKYPENAQRLGTLSAVLSDLKSCEGAGCRAADRDCSADPADIDGDGVVDVPDDPCGEPQPDNREADGPDRQPICHNGKTLYLPEPAINAHLNHGPLRGVCGTPQVDGGQ
jgi:hypothetical protein